MKTLATAFILVLACATGYGQLMPLVIFPHGIFLQDTSQLPLRGFDVTLKDNKALIKWKADSLSAAESFYAVEKSSNGVDFNLAGITKNTAGAWFEFLDDAPSKGKVFYRIKLSTAQTSYYSIIISATPIADPSCKFYPNPVDKVLIIRSELGIELQISDRFGKALITDKFPGGLKVIDVSSLEPGIYVITLFQKETSRMMTEKLVKK